MSTNITMTYGSYSFDPVPSVSYSRSAERTPGKDFCLTSPIQVTLEGILRPADGAGGFGGFQNIVSGLQQLTDVFKCGTCETFLVQCDAETPWFNAPARVLDINVSPRTEADLYVQTAQYSITLEMISQSGTAYDNGADGISAISEDWNVEFLDERAGGTASSPNGGSVSIGEAYTISHSVTVTAPYECTSGDGLDIAEAYLVANYSSSSPSGAYVTGILSPTTNFYNHFRTTSKNPFEGTVTMNETWVAADTGALEDFDVQMERNIDSEITTVTINGNVQGLADGDSYPGATFTNPKLSNATEYWNTSVLPNLYSRANALYTGTRTLKTDPTNQSYGYNSTAGTITYNYTYDNRPNSVINDNSRAETINVVHNDPADVFTSLTVLGRTQGPLFQEVNTVGPRTRELSIEAIMETSDTISLTPPTGYDDYMDNYEATLTGTYDQVFLNSQSKTWSPKDGRFTFSKSWTVGSCTS